MRLDGDTLVLSERNLLALLSKLYTKGSARTLEGGSGCPLSVAAEKDGDHYGARGYPAGSMHAVTERVLAAVREATEGASI